MEFQGVSTGEQKHVDDPDYTPLLLRFPGEIRNRIYDYVVAGHSEDSGICSTPALAQVNRKLRQEFLSYYYEHGVFAVNVSSKESLRLFYKWILSIGDENVARIGKFRISVLAAPLSRNRSSHSSSHTITYKIACSVYMKAEAVVCHRKHHPSRWSHRQHERAQSIIVRDAVQSAVDGLLGPLWKQKSITGGDLAERVARLSKWDAEIDGHKAPFAIVKEMNHDALGEHQRRNSMGGVQGRFASLNLTTPASSTAHSPLPVATNATNATISIQQLLKLQGNPSNCKPATQTSVEISLDSCRQAQHSQLRVVDDSSSTDCTH